MRKVILMFIPLVLIFFGFIMVEKANALNEENTAAPDFVLKDLKGANVALSDYKGKVIFLNFWATWCGPCRAEIPDFIEAYEKYNKKGLEIIGISLDRGGSAKVLAFVEEHKINYPIVMGTQKVLNDYQPGHFIPTTIIIDRNGKIKHKHVGIMDKETLEKIFLGLSAKK